jgi:hypothetical protein
MLDNWLLLNPVILTIVSGVDLARLAICSISGDSPLLLIKKPISLRRIILIVELATSTSSKNCPLLPDSTSLLKNSCDTNLDSPNPNTLILSHICMHLATMLSVLSLIIV